MMMSSQFSNLTNGIKNDAERFTWAGWLILVFLASIAGDTTILIASIKYNAFKLHNITVAFIQHIAVCDLIVSIVSISTQGVSLMANRWVFGRYICSIRVYTIYYCNLASILLICGMTVCKLHLLRYPLRAGSWSRREAHMICAGIWTLSLCSPVMLLLVDKDDVFFYGITYTCGYAFSSKKWKSDMWKYLEPIIYMLFVLIPTIIIIATSIFLLKHLFYARKVVKRSRGNVRWQGITTVVLTAAVYCISFLPLTVHQVAESYVADTTYEVYAPRVTDALNCLNVVANFFIYSITVASFRAFLGTRIAKIMSYVSCANVNTERSAGATDAETDDVQRTSNNQQTSIVILNKNLCQPATIQPKNAETDDADGTPTSNNQQTSV